MGLAQGRHGYVTIGAVQYPVFNWAMPNPRNIVAPLPAGNTWGTNFAEGLQTTRFVATMDLRVKLTECLALAFWNHFLARTFAGGLDDTAVATIVGFNGYETFTLANAKAEAFTLSITKGMQIGMQVVFVAPGIPTPAIAAPINYSRTVDNSAPLMFNNHTLSGFTGDYYGFELTYANNHVLDAPLDGTKFGRGYDAGPMTCGARITFDAKTQQAQDLGDGDVLTLSLVGGATRVLTLSSVIPNNNRDRGVDSLGPQFITYDMLVQGTAVNPPLLVT